MPDLNALSSGHCLPRGDTDFSGIANGLPPLFLLPAPMKSGREAGPHPSGEYWSQQLASPFGLSYLRDEGDSKDVLTILSRQLCPETLAAALCCI